MTTKILTQSALYTFAMGAIPYMATSKVAAAPTNAQPNIVFVFADEWRAQATGYAGDSNVYTPNLDKLASESVNVSNTVSVCPVCGPYRASFLTGQYPLTNGFFMNDVELNPNAQSLGKVYKSAGYNTAYIGKWHLDGNGRSSFIPAERRQGFDYWKVIECTHNYNKSYYWDNELGKKKWDGYDAYAQTSDAINYINNNHKSEKPFIMLLSWGPPHTPFATAPQNWIDFYKNKKIKLRANIPVEKESQTRNDLIGYYAHISALDSCIGALQRAIKDVGIENNTIFVFTSDHGALIHSHGQFDKQQPYDESIMVPFLIKYPAKIDSKGKNEDMLFNTPDIMPTLLGLCGLQIPSVVEGNDKSQVLMGKTIDKTEATLIACYQPFGQWSRAKGGVEYRGVRTKNYTFVRKLNGPWLLFDNQKDPYQLNNLVNQTAYGQVQQDLDQQLSAILTKQKDEFRPGIEYIRQWNYTVDSTETVPFRKINFKGLPIE